MKDLVRALRKEKGDPTQAAFARLLGVSEAAVNNWERGKNRPTPAVLKRMIETATPGLAAKLRHALDSYKWHGPREQASRYSAETRQALIEALDIILERAPSGMVDDVAKYLSERASRATMLRGGSDEEVSGHRARKRSTNKVRA